MRNAPPAIDPEHKQLHRVLTARMEQYKAARIQTVRATCGKVWAPTLPPPKNLREVPPCPICFPSEQHRFTLAM